MSSLCTIDNSSSIVSIKELNPDEQLMHMENISYAKQLILIYSATESMDVTFHELNELIEAYLSKRINLAVFSKKVVTRCENFLSATRGYIDTFAHTLSENFGRDSTIFKLFIDEKSKHFDLSFSYRFTEQIRNYCQHRAAPIDAIEAYVENGVTRIWLFAYTSKLLSDKKFKDSVVKHLPNFEDEYPEKIDLLYHFKNMYCHLKDINHVIFMSQYDDTKIEHLFDTAKPFLKGSEDLAVIDFEENQDKLSIKILGCYQYNWLQSMIARELEIEEMFFSH